MNWRHNYICPHLAEIDNVPLIVREVQSLLASPLEAPCGLVEENGGWLSDLPKRTLWRSLKLLEGLFEAYLRLL